MRAGGGDGEPFTLRRTRRSGPQDGKRLVDLADVRADAGVRLEHGREELGLQSPRQVDALDAAQDPVDCRDLLVRLRVEDHQLLLDTERERRALAEVPLDHAVLTPCTGRPAAIHA